MGLLATEVRCSTGTHAMARLDSSLESAGAEFLVLGHLLIALKMFKERARTRAKKFCSYVNRGLPQYREAGEIFKRYVDEGITAEELEAAINDQKPPNPASLLPTYKNGPIPLHANQPRFPTDTIFARFQHFSHDWHRRCEPPAVPSSSNICYRRDTLCSVPQSWRSLCCPCPYHALSCAKPRHRR